MVQNDHKGAALPTFMHFFLLEVPCQLDIISLIAINFLFQHSEEEHDL